MESQDVMMCGVIAVGLRWREQVRQIFLVYEATGNMFVWAASLYLVLVHGSLLGITLGITGMIIRFVHMTVRTFVGGAFGTAGITHVHVR